MNYENPRRRISLTVYLVVLMSLRFADKTFVYSAERTDVTSVPSCSDANVNIIAINVSNAAELQEALNRNAGMSRCIRMSKTMDVRCTVREDLIDGEKSVHALLIPPGVRLDLNNSTLLLDLRSNSYGVRLSSNSAICNGTISVIGSEGKGAQSCWHSGISIGAAYGDGGTPERPGRFSTVTHWAVENMTIDQRFAASAIQLMSEACHGVIRNVRILDSNEALLGIGLDWGSVGPLTTEDGMLPRMRQLWEHGQIYSTHPHDIVIENIQIGKLLRNKDANDSGVRVSACHNITIRNIEIDTAATAVMVVGGDLGYEFARKDQRGLDHSGHVIENVQIGKALRFGMVLNGLADNVWRSMRDFGYQPVCDPAHPGLDRLRIQNVTLTGNNNPDSQGIYAVSLTDAKLEGMAISAFGIGVHVEDWVRGMSFANSKIAGNKKNTLVEGATEPAIDVVFDPMP